ncbi:SMAD/FHA domain-containing protein [Gongronella butleri]|nr:SMAD/FHA domain-containing protein [Gongronella butleri]
MSLSKLTPCKTDTSESGKSDKTQQTSPEQLQFISIQIERGAQADQTTSPINIGTIKRRLTQDEPLLLGRHLERHLDNYHINFKSKVVSRQHARVWTNSDMQVFIQDCGSSTGTFVNGVRLSESGKESNPFQLHDNDMVRLGSNYRGGLQDLFRCVTMQICLNRRPKYDIHNMQECCICLNPIAPNQALFVSACRHVFHYKCVRRMLIQSDRFKCPLCRAKSDLNGSDDDF